MAMELTDPYEMLAMLAYRKGGWRALARELNVSPSYISSVKVGRKPIPDKLLAMIGLRRVVTVTYEPLEPA